MYVIASDQGEEAMVQEEELTAVVDDAPAPQEKPEPPQTPSGDDEETPAAPAADLNISFTSSANYPLYPPRAPAPEEPEN